MTEAKIAELVAKEDSVYKPVDKEIDIQQKIVTGKEWRLVYNALDVIALEEGNSDGATYTLDKCLEFKTKDDAIAEINRLRLKYDDPDNLVKPKL